MNIPAQLLAIAILVHKLRFVPPLKQGPCSFIPSIVILGIFPVDFLHDLRQICMGRFQIDMVMIGHQAVTMTDKGGRFLNSGKNTAENLKISLVAKDLAPFQAARIDVIESTRIFNP